VEQPIVTVGDAEAARALLAEAGFPGGQGLPPFELAVDSRPTHQALAAAAAARWRDELGLQVTPYVRQYSAHADAVREGSYQVARGGWLGDYPDPTSFLDLLRGDNPLNDAGWRDAGYDALLDEALRADDEPTRARMLRRAEDLLQAGAPVLPLYHFGSLSLLKPWVDGFTDNPLQVHLLRYVSVGARPTMRAG